jgi:hypothetical protein
MSAAVAANDNGPDLQFANLGSFVACRATTAQGYAWLVDNVEFDPALSLASDTILLEHRCLADIVIGARSDGLVCDG